MGKSKRVASIRVVSSIDTVSTQSKVSPSGRESSSSAVRSRIIGSMLRRLLGADTSRTVLRWSVWVGGSIAMNGASDCGGICSAVAISLIPRLMPFTEE